MPPGMYTPPPELLEELPEIVLFRSENFDAVLKRTAPPVPVTELPVTHTESRVRVSPAERIAPPPVVVTLPPASVRALIETSDLLAVTPSSRLKIRDRPPALRVR